MVAPALRQEFGFENAMEVPRLQKVVLNVGVGEAKEDAREFPRRRIESD